MITPILENLIIQGLAQVNHKTLGQNGVSTISVPENQSIVITKISIQPFVNPSFNDNFGGQGSIGQINDAESRLYYATVNNNGFSEGLIAPNSSIIKQMLNRGTFQIELVSSDNGRTIFTFGTDFNFVYLGGQYGDPALAPVASRVMLMPALTERSTDCYSVHKNNVHIRLRFINSYIAESNTQFVTQFKSYTQSVSDQDISNTIPENRPTIDINSANLFFNTAVYSAVPGVPAAFGFYPFGVETNIENLKAFNSSDTITFPYYEDNANIPLEGRGGEASFYTADSSTGTAYLLPYLNAFIPYINVEYVLINEKADGATLVKAERYNNVTVKK